LKLSKTGLSQGKDFFENNSIKDCLKIVNCYDIPPFRQTFEFYIVIAAGTWNRRNKSKNNGSMSFSSYVTFGRWNVVFAFDIIFRQTLKIIHLETLFLQQISSA